jgi:hypothetical protein
MEERSIDKGTFDEKYSKPPACLRVQLWHADGHSLFTINEVLL